MDVIVLVAVNRYGEGSWLTDLHRDKRVLQDPGPALEGQMWSLDRLYSGIYVPTCNLLNDALIAPILLLREGYTVDVEL